jgi:hypothetical protein
MGRLSRSVIARGVATVVCAVGCSSGEDSAGSGPAGSSSGTSGASGGRTSTGGVTGTGGASSETSGSPTGGASCVGTGALPELPCIENLVPTVRGDTATVTFEAVLDALDYRIYPLPSNEDVLVGTDGEVVVKNAIYRCSGAQPRADRRTNEFKHLFPFSLEGNVKGYTRSHEESVLGHVFLSPGPDRTPVYRAANPNLVGGYAWE